MQATAQDIRIPQHCFGSVDLSKSKWVVSILTPVTDRIATHTLEGGDTSRLLAVLRQAQQEACKAMGDPVGITFCYESGYDGFWLQRLLSNKGIGTIVFDPTSFLVNRRARRVKTDRIDAEAMVRILKAYVGGDKSVARALVIPSEAEEDAKRLHREHNQLVRERTEQISRIRALFALQGVRHINPKSVKWRANLENLRTADGRPYPSHALAEIRRIFVRLELIAQLLKENEMVRDEIMKTEDAKYPAKDKVELLEKMRGVGRHSAMLLVSEIFYRQFRNRRHLASFLGLAPSPFASGEVNHNQGISKAGNKQARHLSVELAWSWLRYQPDSALSKWYRNYVGARSGAIGKTAIIALARKLIIALWRYVETGLVPSGAILKGAV